MNAILKRLKPSQQTVSFSLAALIVLVAGGATMLDQVGPGVASAWSAAGLNAAQPIDADNAPLYRLLVQAVGGIGPKAAAHLRIAWLTVFGWALLAGCLAGLLTALFQRWGVWAAWILGTVGGASAAMARIVWATALAPNPAPWALGALAAGFWLLIQHPADNRKRVSYALIGLLYFNLALQFDVMVALAVLPMVGLAVYRNYQAKTSWWLFTAVIILPMLLRWVPSIQPTLAVSGYFSAPQGIPENLNGFPLLGWSLLHTMTIIPLFLALWGAIVLFRRERYSIWVVVGFAVGIVAGALFGGNISLFGALLASLLAMVLAGMGLADLFFRLPRGLAPVAILLLPVIAFLQGPDLSRKGEKIWDDHQQNVVRASRYQSLILSVDEATVNSPRAYKRASQRVRPDVRLINPLRLTEFEYLEWMNNTYRQSFRRAAPLFDSLLVESRKGSSPSRLRPLAASFLESWVSEEVEMMDGSGGVLVSPGYDPGTDYQLVPEGLLMRVWDGETAFPFLFRLLKLEHIRFTDGQTHLETGVVAQYPMMFTNRGTWMLSRRYHPEGMDYIRYALAINPRYTPARIIAEEYNIHGAPLFMKPKQGK